MVVAQIGCFQIRWRRRYLGYAAIILAALAVALYFATEVDTSLTAADREAIEALDLDDACADVDGFDDEIQCIRTLQDKLLEFSSDLTCTDVGPDVAREPTAFLERGYGCCFDRSRFIEKALSHYGFEVRHVAIHQLEKPFPIGYLEPGIRSHAFSEVRTERGWMLVESLAAFVGLDKNGRVYTAPEFKEAMAESEDFSSRFDTPIPGDLKLDYHTAYGLYSRHGKFYPPYLPLPDIKWSQFMANFAP
ncbi:MAG: hypothetical protein ACLFVJ_11975 [Persicimonas sp.]